MTPTGNKPAGNSPAGGKLDMAPGSTWGGTIAAIVVLVVCLGLVDRFLAKVESNEVEKGAQRSYELGSRLLAEGKADEAVEPLSDAHAAERQNVNYELQLITALVDAGKIGDAEPLLTEILQREPNDGEANLIAARLMTKKGDLGDAEAYYHRAIYGEWPGDAETHRIAVRMELIDLLAKKNQKQELLAELISLEAESPKTEKIQNRIAKLFLLAGAPGRAASVYEELAAKNPKDIAAYEGIGEADLEQGEYREAHEAFLRAFLREPNNESVRAHLETLNTVTSLDPTQRKLTSAEKYRRSIRILDMARSSLEQCVAKSAPGAAVSGATAPSVTPSGATAPGGDIGNLLTMAQATVTAKPPAHVTNEISEGVLSLSEKLWQAEKATCGETLSAGSADQNPLSLIMMKLAS